MKHWIFNLFILTILLCSLAGCSPDYTELSWKPIEQPNEKASEPTFGPETYSVLSLEVFKNQLYAGLNTSFNSARIYRTGDGKTWEPVSEIAFGYPPPENSKNIDYSVWDLQEFQDQLYAGVNQYDSDKGVAVPSGAQVWRSSDGAQWENVVAENFGNSDFLGVTSFAVFEDHIYAAIGALDQGFQVWRSPTGDPGSWTMVAEDSLGFPSTRAAFMFPFKGKLVLIGTNFSGGYAVEPVRIWITENGATWTPVTTDGFGILAHSPSHPTIYKDNLYLGAFSMEHNIWRSKNGVDWEPVETEGFESPIYNFSALFTDGNYLLANVTQHSKPFLYYSTDGKTWKQIPETSHGYNNSWGIGYNPTAVFDTNLYFGGGEPLEAGANDAAQVWRLCVECE